MTTNALQTGYLETGGTKIYYEVMGEGHPLVLIHGINIDRRMWDFSFAELAKHYRVIRYDLRGFGNTAMTEAPFSNYDDLDALLSHLGIEKAHLCGLSFGGYTALEYTIAHPEKVEKLIVCASALIGHPPSPERIKAREEFMEIVKSGDVERGIENTIQQWLFGPGQTGERIAPEVYNLFREMTVHAFSLPQVQNAPKFIEPPVIERLGEIKVPTLVLTGELDYIDFTRIAEKLAREIENAKHISLPNAAHLFPMELPERFNELVFEFLGT
jgi:3-oxoadipate enol-lactonase